MREPGFYWVRLERLGHAEPVVAQWIPDYHGPGEGVFMFDSTWSKVTAVEVLSERLQPPGELDQSDQCRQEIPTEVRLRPLLDIYKEAALHGKRMIPGNRMEVDGRFCKLLVRHPKQPAAKRAPDAPPTRAKAAPKPAGAPAGRKRRPPPAR